MLCGKFIMYTPFIARVIAPFFQVNLLYKCTSNYRLSTGDLNYLLLCAIFPSMESDHHRTTDMLFVWWTVLRIAEP